jgi:hypothetical protein
VECIGVRVRGSEFKVQGARFGVQLNRVWLILIVPNQKMCASGQSAPVAEKLKPARISFSRVKLPGEVPRRRVENAATVGLGFENHRLPFGSFLSAAEGFVHSVCAKWEHIASRAREAVFREGMRRPLFLNSGPRMILASMSLSNEPERMQQQQQLQGSESRPTGKRKNPGGIQIGQEGGGGQEEERVLISEILIQDKDGQVLADSELLTTAWGALKACKPNFALTTSEVQEDVHRIIDTGFFASCMPSAEDTRDGVRLIFKVRFSMSEADGS